MDLFTDLPPVFENWQIPSEGAVGEEVSFGPEGGSAPVETAPTWRLDLPADPALAGEQLSRAEAQVAAAEQALETIPAQLDDLVRRARGSTAGSIAFGPIPAAGASDRAFSQDERELLAWVAAADPSQVYFSAPGAPTGELVQVGGEIQQAVERLLQLLLHLAWVETQVQGELAARTVVGWTGDLGTAWELALTEDLFSLHQRALRLALASRLIMLRTLIVVTQGAVKLSALIAAPGGAFLALPAAWKYVNRVLAELKNYTEIAKESEEE